jgi:hypothetical protein
MHILIGALVGAVVSVALTYAASLVIKKPITWKDLTASLVAGLIGGAVATATLGVGAATTARTVVAFAAGGATGSSSGQITDNVLHGHPVHEGVVKSTAMGTVIGAGTLGAGKLAAPVFKHAGRLVGLGRGASGAAASTGHGGHSNSLAGAAAGLDDAIVPVYRYVKKALGEEAEGEGEQDSRGEQDSHGEQVLAEPTQPAQGGMLDALTQGLTSAAQEPAQSQGEVRPEDGWAQRLQRSRAAQRESAPQDLVGLPLGR